MTLCRERERGESAAWPRLVGPWVEAGPAPQPAREEDQ